MNAKKCFDLKILRRKKLHMMVFMCSMGCRTSIQLLLSISCGYLFGGLKIECININKFIFSFCPFKIGFVPTNSFVCLNLFSCVFYLLSMKTMYNKLLSCVNFFYDESYEPVFKSTHIFYT